MTALDEPPGSASPRELLEIIRNALHLQNVAYLAVHAPPLTRDGPYIEVTYSDAWVTHYKAQGYVQHDPVLSEPAKSILPTDWNTLDRSSSRNKRLFQDAILFGVGNQGLTVPIRGANGERAFFSITRNASDEDWKQFKRDTLPLIIVTAHVFHETVLKARGVVPPTIALSAREAEVLGWISAGKNAADVAIILNMSVHTVRTHLDTARHKLGAINITHAVRRALEHNLIFPPE